MHHTAFTIVCNQREWLEHNVRHHAPMFDRIIVVEGPALEIPAGRGNGLRLTGGLPASTDGTVEVMDKLAKEIPNFFPVNAGRIPWKGKTEMCDAALRLARPGIIWQVDVDEFWDADTVAETKFLAEETDYTDFEFFAYHFWPTPEYHVSFWELVQNEKDPTKWDEKLCWGNRIPWRRVFKWDGKCSWKSHEPPRLDRPEVLLGHRETLAFGLKFYHYGYCTRKQFRDREIFYNLPKGNLTTGRDEWLVKKDVSINGVCPPSVAGPLEKFAGKHPIDISWIHD